MHPAKRVLILSATFGNGHEQASRATKEGIKRLYPESEVTVIDFMGEMHPLMNNIMSDIYSLTCKWLPRLYGWVYYATAPLTKDTWLRKILGLFGIRKMERYVLQTNPDVIVATFPMAACVLAALAQRGKLKVPFVTIVTDYALHSQWLYDEVDHYYVASDQLQREMVEWGIPNEKISVTGIPIRPDFYLPLPLKYLREKYPQSISRPFVLIMANGLGTVHDICNLCLFILKKSKTAQLIVICGKDRHRYDRLSEKLSDVQNRVTIIRFTDQIHEWMQTADFMVSKPGGLTTTEALVSGLPMVLFRPVPGQELENARYLQSKGFAQWAHHRSELHKIVEDLLNHTYSSETTDPEVECVQSGAVFEIAKSLMELDDLPDNRSYVRQEERLFLSN